MPTAAPIGRWFVTGAILLLTNAGLLVLQLLAGRYLAPFVGSSVETWTAVIAVFLTGIALGNYLGGRLADKGISGKTLAAVLLLGALATLTLPAGMRLCMATGIHSAIPLGVRIPLLALLFCLAPATILSAITPLIIRLSLADVRMAGRVAGVSFALGTLGCLVGNYLTGFELMAHFELDQITLAIAGLNLVLAGLALTQPAQVAVSRVEVAVKNEGFLPMRRAFAIVFVASFCGMSLELAGARVMAPIVGVSIYSWTGVIGVMLAGTACGNFLGGILADRGPRAAVVPALMLMAFIAGLGGSVPGIAYLMKNEIGKSPSWVMEYAWPIRGAMALLSALIVWGLCFWHRYSTGRVWVAGILGGIGGALLLPLVVRQFERLAKWLPSIFDPERLPFEQRFPESAWLLAVIGFFIGIGVGLWLRRFDKIDPAGEEDRPALPLSTTIFAASAATLAIVTSVATFRESSVLGALPLIERIMAWTFLLFFVPMLCLGMVSPQVIRLAIPDMARAGQAIGSIYAWSTAGAIAGTLITGYISIELLGMTRVVMAAALILGMLAFVIGRLWRTHALLFMTAVVGGGAACGMFLLEQNAKNKYVAESKYYAISVREETREGLRYATLILDRLIHSSVCLDDPTFLHYQHEEVQGELTRLAHEEHPDTHVLVIGGGGYTYPHWVETLLPDVHVEVVEIDPAVTRVAHQWLGLPNDTTIVSHHLDGRQFIAERAPKKHYQLVMQDAVNDLSVPYHLLTREYNEAVKAILADDGAYLLTLIDHPQSGRLWKAAADTMQATFAHVYLLAPDAFWEGNNPDARNVFILYGSNRELNMDALKQVLAKANKTPGKVWTKVMPDEKLSELLSVDYISYYDAEAQQRKLEKPRPRERLILTDQFSPVDTLMSATFRRRE